jgi:DNA-binding MarR family transcriptional regulator
MSRGNVHGFGGLGRRRRTPLFTEHRCSRNILYAPLTIFVMYRIGVDDSAQAAAAPAGAADLRREADGQHTGASDAATGLVQLSSLVQGVYARISQRHNLTPVQARLLCILADGPRGMAELARCFGVEKAALTGLIDRAERRGLAKRTPVQGDRRALRVTLTEAGHRAATAFHAEVSAELSCLLSPLAPHDRAHFRRSTAAIIAGCRPALGAR